MSFEQFGGVSIFRPSLDVEAFVREQTRVHLFSRFTPGEYRGSKSANAIIQHQMECYDRLLRPLIPKLASDDGVAFLLFQFDEACRILHGQGSLDLREREKWMWIEPCLKRAIKFLVELVCMETGPLERVRDSRQAALVTEIALVCAESLADLAQQSDLIHSVFPDDCVVRVFDSGTIDFEIKIEGRFTGYDRVFADRIIRDRNARKDYVGFPQFDFHTATHQRYLDKAFSNSFGMNYGEFIACITSVIDGCQPSLHPKAFPTLFVHRGQVIDELAKSGRSRVAIERALDGFSITPAKLIAERRVIWKPKQKSRAYRRGFYVLPHKTGPHIAFSRAMARENLIQMVNWVCYKQLPEEWKTPETQKALAELSLDAGAWFEDSVCRNLKALGFVGQRVNKTIGNKQLQLQIPSAIGEIDFLGYHAQQKLIVVAEAKMAMTGLEASYWRDDLAEFVSRPGSYAERFRRKILWVKENQKAISAALGLTDVSGIGCVMLTLYPCIARLFVNDFPCVSLAEFMLDYQRQSKWPYPLKTI